MKDFHRKEDCPQTAVTAIDVSAIQTALTGAISPEQIVTLLATAIGAGIGLVLVWFGARKLVSVVMSALKKGRLSI